MSAFAHAEIHDALLLRRGHPGARSDASEIERLARRDPLALSFRFGPRGDTPLHAAAREGDAAAVAVLCAAKANPNAPDYRLDTPLHVAAAQNHVRCAVLLLSRGADIEARNKNGLTPFLSACWFGAVECMRALHARGAKVKRVKTKAGETAAHVAAISGEVGALVLLEEFGVDLHRDETRQQAAAAGWHECVEFLFCKAKNKTRTRAKTCTSVPMHNTARVNRLDAQGLSALHLCVGVSASEAESSMDATAAQRLSSHQSRSRSSSVKTARLLLSLGADVDIRGPGVGGTRYLGQTPLMVSAAAGNSAAIEVLVKEFGARLHIFNKDGQGYATRSHTPRAIALEKGHEETVRTIDRLLTCAHGRLGCSAVAPAGVAAGATGTVWGDAAGGMCRFCGSVFYCCFECRRKDFNGHKRLCAQIQAYNLKRLAILGDAQKKKQKQKQQKKKTKKKKKKKKKVVVAAVKKNIIIDKSKNKNKKNKARNLLAYPLLEM